MKIPNFLLLCDVADGGGMGGDTGGEAATDTGGSPSGGGGGNGATSAYDLDDDTPIRIKGQKDPVKFGDWYKGLRASQTKEAQARADYERKYGELEAGHRTLKQQYDDLLKAVQKAQAGGSKEDALKELRALSYIDGGTAAQMIEAVQQRIAATDAGFAERDKAIVYLGRQLAGVLKRLEVGDQRTQASDFETKIDGFLKNGGYGAEYKDLAKEIYLAYEGEDLDEEFPTILKTRVGQIEKAIRARDQRIQAERRKGMFIPGAEKPHSPSGALSQKRLARGKPKDIAGAVWDAMVGDQPSDRT